jgi:hypothetical protein
VKILKLDATQGFLTTIALEVVCSLLSNTADELRPGED